MFFYKKSDEEASCSRNEVLLEQSTSAERCNPEDARSEEIKSVMWTSRNFEEDSTPHHLLKLEVKLVGEL